MRLAEDLILLGNNPNDNLKLYTDYYSSNTKIHTLFRINTNTRDNKCVYNGCNVKRLGIIYHSKKKSHYHNYLNWNFYNKRFIPYCLLCYKEQLNI